jgi:colanic acid/amylovoran biosynthesis glycosyltransferase
LYDVRRGTSREEMGNMKKKPHNIVVFRDPLLSSSETFILSQTVMLSQYVPYFAGSHRVKGLELNDQRVIVINKTGSLLEIIKEKLFKLVLHPPSTLISQMRAISPVLIHAHFALDGVLALPIARKMNIPLLVTLHGYDVTVIDESWAKHPSYTGRRFPARRPKLIDAEFVQFIAVSEHIKRKAVASGYPEDRITVHYIGVDTDRFVPVDHIPDKVSVLFVGRLVEKKGCSYLIQAMRQVQKVIPNAELVIVGDGPLRAELEVQAKGLDNCTFMGMQNHTVVMELMRKSRVFCIPSVTSSTGDTEGLPIVVYEAMATGIPIASTYSAGIPEAVIHGRTGLLAPERDVEVLADNLTRLLQDEALWSQFSSHSREVCERSFSLAVQSAELEKIYSLLIDRHRGV